MKHTILRFLALVIGALPLAAGAQDWMPTKPIRLIVPVIGGTVDILARLAAPKLQEAWGQTVIVENKPGAGGNLGADFVAKSSGDGHTVLVGFTAPITVNITLFDTLPYDPQKDLSPLTLAVSTHQFLVVHRSVPVKTVAELIAYAKANPGMPYGSIGVGGASHLTMEMFKSAAGINLTHVPYKGLGPAIADLLAGHVQAAYFVAGNVLPYLKDGKMRALAATGRHRFGSVPNIPTMIESGFPEFEAVAWIGFLAPGTTPKPIADRWHRELVRILALPDVRKRLTDLEFEIVASTPEQFAEYIRGETVRWAKVIRETGAKAN